MPELSPFGDGHTYPQFDLRCVNHPERKAGYAQHNKGGLCFECWQEAQSEGRRTLEARLARYRSLTRSE